MTNDLRQLSDELKNGCGLLMQDKLIPLQQQCVNEIQTALTLVSKAVSSYYSALDETENHNGHDARYRLMYAARTPLAMMHQATYLLFAYHNHEVAALTPTQSEQIRQIDQAGRKMVIEIERLWSEMLFEQTHASQSLMD